MRAIGRILYKPFYLQQRCTNGFYYLSANTTEKNGGGLVVFYGTLLNFVETRKWLFLNLLCQCFFLVRIYRRPNTYVRVFLSDITSFIEEKALLFKKLLIVGDIEISMLLSNDASRNTISFLDEFGLQQELRCLLTKVVEF